MPFHLYEHKSLIVWGNKDYLDAGDQRHGKQLAYTTQRLLHHLFMCR
jgi:hypothetical protein